MRREAGGLRPKAPGAAALDVKRTKVGAYFSGAVARALGGHGRGCDNQILASAALFKRPMRGRVCIESDYAGGETWLSLVNAIERKFTIKISN
ncbi:MAG: hypothetical protein J0L81_13290 [Caulobacterales bacterium]|jgi:hypothetical protein|nr:hypothetical protein [Caulobacterales bacterium]